MSSLTLDPCVFAVPWIPSAHGEAQGVPTAEMKLLRSCFNLTPQMPGWLPFDRRRGGPDPIDFEIERGARLPVSWVLEIAGSAAHLPH